MLYFRIAVKLLALSIGIAGCDGAESNEAKLIFWEKRIGTDSLQQVVEGLRAREGSWPKLGSELTNTKLLAREREIALRFIAICNAAHPFASGQIDRQSIDNYAEITSNLKRAGGYFNSILLDTTFRLALSDLATEAIKRPKDAQSFEVLLQGLDPGPWKSAQVPDLLADYLNRRNQIHEFEGWSEDTKLTQIGMLLNAKLPNRTEDTSSFLIMNVSLPGLITRLVGTQMFFAYSIPGLLAFFGKAGNLSKISYSDATELDSVMGNDRLKFQFPMLGIRMLRAGDIVAMKNSFAANAKRDRFLDVALM